MKSLEKEIGLTLFERRNARIFLTREGEELYRAARKKIHELNDRVARLRNDSTQLTGTIKIGVLLEFCRYLLPDIIKKFRQSHPKARFQVMPLHHENLEGALIENEVDVAFIAFYKEKRFFETKAYIKTKKYLYTAPRYLKKKGPLKKFEDLGNVEILALGERLHSFRQWLKDNNRSLLVPTFDKLKPSIIVEELATLNHLLSEGLGVGFTYSFMVEKEVEKGRLVRLFPKAKPITINFDVARRKVRTPNLLHDHFWEFLQKHEVGFVSS